MIKPHIDKNTSVGLKFRFQRWIFKKNSKYVKKFVVQSEPMKRGLMLSYSIEEYKIVIISQPPPIFFNNLEVSRQPLNKFSLFYPAAFYPHKNHALIQKIDRYITTLDFEIELVITVEPDALPFDTSDKEWIKCVGILSQAECLEQYMKCSALFFPSLMESYGLPLLEAMYIGIPIICSDLPYARWMCSEGAFYFDPFEGLSACEAIKKMKDSLKFGLDNDWKCALGKFPNNWSEVALGFIKLI